MMRPSTKPARGLQAVSQRSNEHVDLGRGDVVELGETAAGAADGAEGEVLVEDEAEFVLLFQLDLYPIPTMISSER